MTGPDTAAEPAEIGRVRELEAHASALARRLRGDGDTAALRRALDALDEAERLAGGRGEVLAWLASSRAAVWTHWAAVAGPGQRVERWRTVVAARRDAVRRTPAGSPAVVLRQANLAADLLDLYRQSGENGHLDEAIDLLGHVLDATPPEDPARAGRASNLAVALGERYRLTGAVADLDTSITVLRAAADSAPDAEIREAALINLAAAYRARFRALGEPADLDHAEDAARSACATGDDPAAMSALGLTLANRYEALGGAATLAEAVQWLTRAVETTPPTAPDHPTRLTNLALALLNRGEFVTGARADLDRAIDLLRDAVRATPTESTDRPSRLSNLGGALRRRALRYGRPPDLDEAISAYQAALQACPPGHIDRFAYVNNLANGLRDRYQRTGVLADLDQAITLLTEAADTVQVEAMRSRLLGSLGIALGERAEQGGGRDELDRAVTAFRRALALTPQASPLRLRAQVNLAAALHSRHAVTGAGAADRGDLDEAIGLMRAAVAQLPPSAVPDERAADHAEAFNMLAIALAALAERTTDPADGAAAFAAAQAALARTPAESPTWAEHASNLAVIAGDHALLPAPEIEQRFRAAVAAAERTNHSVAVYNAGNWARWAEGRADWPTAVTAYQHALDAMAHLDRAQGSRRDRERWLTAATGLAARAGYAALAAPAPDPPLAMRLVDRGQAVLLAAALRGPDSPPPAPDLGEDILRRATPLAADGPIVSICATARGGFALALTGDGAVHDVRLPELTTQRVTRWARRLTTARPGVLRPLLAELWDTVMAPILDRCPADATQLTLMPAGSVRLLPLHAAGRPDPATGSRHHLLDRITISYAPNLGALLTRQDRADIPLLPALLVTDPQADDLRYAELELTAVARHFPGTRDHIGAGNEPTVAQVVHAMRTAGLVHFACHGTADRHDPGRSSVQLADGPLSVREILRLAPRRDHPARLVVLSACESAAIGDVLPDEAISLPVALVEWGAVGVIGTLWRVADESTAILMSTFYDLWRGGLPIPDALAAAARTLRTLTNAELLARYPALFADRASRVPAGYRPLWDSAPRYDDPYHWAPFLVLGH